MVLQWSILICLILHQSAGRHFYPYGVEIDERLPLGDDPTIEDPVALSPPFPFFGRRATSLYVNNNGIISLDAPYTHHTPIPFNLTSNNQLIAPFWADVDTSGRGRGAVYYRDASSDTDLLNRTRGEVMMYFTSAMNFRPTFLFIATWDRVSFFGGSRSTLTNTFQCVLVSDGIQSYAFFLYDNGLIQWTTGANSGGVAAQVGYSGNGSSFTVPGSRTPSIINIANTTNVGINGVWAFRLDTVERECNRSNPLRSTPAAGSVLGGTVIFLAGPCFSADEDVVCTFDGSIQVQGSYFSENMSYCVSPYFETSGWKDLQVTIWSSSGMMPLYTGSTQFYARSLDEFSDVLLVSVTERDSLVAYPGTEIAISWNPATLFMMNSSSFTVDLELLVFDLSENLINTNRTTPVATLSSNEVNDGITSIIIPSISLEEDVYAVSIAVVVSAISQSNRNLGGLVGRARLWSRIFFYSQGTANFLNLCQTWVNQQEPAIGETLLRGVIACPRTAQQARALNSGMKEDVGISQLLLTNIAIPGVASCFRQASLSSASDYGQQCCYWSNGSLVTGAPFGGSVDEVSPDGSFWRHLVQDVLPYVYCCWPSQSDCGVYYRYRPSDNGSRYDPPVPACAYGDPHIVSLDGLKYTFNGRGEFILIQSNDNRFSLQGRMVPAVDGDGNSVQATVFSALAAKEEFSSVVQIQLSEDTLSLDMLVNGDPVDFSVIAEQLFANVTVANRGNNYLSARFSSGVYLEARASNGIISTILTSLSRSYQGQTSGLMGNFNSNTTDDLVERGGTMIPITSSLRTIHTFGLSWIISDASESLFTYSGNQTFQSFYHPDFSPTFDLELDPELEPAARMLCGNDQFCLFDVAATGRLEIGLGTAQGNLEFESIVNITTPATCSPACVNGVCVAENSCSCTSGYQGVGCTEPVFLPCDINPCQNGGSCQLQSRSYICSCPQGYSGIRCQIIEGIELPTSTPTSSTSTPTSSTSTPTSSTSTPTSSTSTPTSSTSTPTSSTSTPTSSGSGTGIGVVVPDCTCRRLIDCSIYGKFEDSTANTVISTGEDLRCVIGSRDVPAEIMGEASPMVGMGSGLEASPANPIFIDSTFNTDNVSPGSFVFLREIGFISRSEGIAQCNLTSESASMVLSEILNLRQLTIVYEDSLDQYRSIAVRRNQLSQPEVLSFQELDIPQQCAANKIIQALNSTLSQHQYFCRDGNAVSNEDTFITFTVSCE